MNFFDYFQIVFQAVFLSVFIGRSIVLTAKGERVFVAGSGKKGFGAMLERSFFLFFPLWIAAIVVRSLGFSPDFLPATLFEDLFRSAALQVAGCILLVIGFLVFIAALTSFGRSWRIGIDKKSPGRLVTGGIFALSRNPIFLSIDLYFIGTFLLYSSPFFLISAAVVVLGMHVQILQEERFLVGHYGEPYDAYVGKVRRYF